MPKPTRTPWPSRNRRTISPPVIAEPFSPPPHRTRTRSRTRSRNLPVAPFSGARRSRRRCLVRSAPVAPPERGRGGEPSSPPCLLLPAPLGQLVVLLELELELELELDSSWSGLTLP